MVAGAVRLLAEAMPESELLGNVRTLARWYGWLPYHTHNSQRSEPGFPDLILCRGDQILAVELKSVAGRLSECQKVWLAALVTAGVEVRIWTPEDWLARRVHRELAP